MTKNITLAVDEGLLDRFRLLAARQNTTINALVRKHMEEATGLYADRQAALSRLAELSRNSEAYDRANPVSNGSGARFSREETYVGARFARSKGD